MRAGQLTEKITIQFEEVTQDELGGKVVSMSNRYVDIACHVRVEGGNEADDSDERQVEGKLKAQFTTRFAAGVKMTDRILWSGGWWDITAMVPIGRREWLRMSAEWSDNQADAMSFSEDGALQIIPDTGGLTLPEVVAEYQNNTTGQTFPELVTFYEEETAGAVPKIYYPNFLHVDNFDDTTNVWGANSYTGMLNSGGLTPGHQPEKILHVAEVDSINDAAFLKTLVNNNEFGNKHRFTYDDGTEADEVYSNNPTSVDNSAYNAGYTGTNPRYIIDHYTGLGWYRNSHSVQNSSTGDWYDSRGIYDHYTSVQDFIDKPSTFTYGGFTDWRRPSIQEWTASLGAQDVSNWMTGNDVGSARDVYFPPLNQYARGYGAFIVMLGPHDHSNQNSNLDFSWWFALSQTNGNYVSLASAEAFEGYVTNHNQGTFSTYMCRRHYDNR